MTAARRSRSRAGTRRSKPRYVALMRAINVGGKNKLPMKDLAAIFEDAGAEDVRTYIQSGNVIFAASASAAKAIPGRVRREVEDRFGIRSPVIARSAGELEAVVEGVPFTGKAADETRLHVAFLADRPAPNRARSLDPERSPGDEFRLVGREIYLSLPDGIGRSKLTCDYFDSTLGTISTMRNWRTVRKLASMLDIDA